jgi:hypothetical protein
MIFRVRRSYDFSNVLSCHATLGGATEQYCHASGSGVTAFSKSHAQAETK